MSLQLPDNHKDHSLNLRVLVPVANSWRLGTENPESESDNVNGRRYLAGLFPKHLIRYNTLRFLATLSK